MPQLAWLMIALVFGAAAVGFGQPAPTREGMTGEERRRIYGAVAFAVIALIGLVAFFLTT